MSTLLLSSVRHGVRHNGIAQSVAVCAFDPGAGYVSYRRPAKIDWSSSHSCNCWLHMPLLMVMSMNYLPPRACRVGVPPVSKMPLFKCSLCAWLLGLSMNWTNAISLTLLHILRLSPRSDEATFFLPPAWPDVIVDVLGVGLDTGGDYDLPKTTLSCVIDISSSL